jgi:hypothetical protein
MDKYTVLLRNPKGKRPPERSGYRWNDNIKMDLMEIGFSDVTEFIWFSVGTTVNMAMNFRVP